MYMNQNSSLRYRQAGRKANELRGLMPLLPTVPLTPQNSVLPVLPPFGTENFKLLFATNKNSFNLDSMSLFPC